jgi:hypothetical protein
LTCAKEIIKALENYNKPQFDYLVKSITGWYKKATSNRCFLIV